MTRELALRIKDCLEDMSYSFLVLHPEDENLLPRVLEKLDGKWGVYILSDGPDGLSEDEDWDPNYVYTDPLVLLEYFRKNSRDDYLILNSLLKPITGRPKGNHIK